MSESYTDETEAPGSSGRMPDLLQVALRRYRLVLLAAGVCLALGTLYYAQASPVYESRAQLLVIKRRPDTMPVSGAESRASQAEDYLSTHAGIVKSPLIVGRAVKEHHLAALPWLEHSKDPTANILLVLKASRDARDARNSIMDLSLRAEGREEDGQKVLSAIIDTYQKFLGENYQNISDETVKLVTRARDILEKDLGRKEHDYREFRIKTPQALLRGKDGNTFNHSQLLALHQRQLALQVRRDEIQGRLDSIEKATKNGNSREELIAMVSQLTSKSVPDGSSRLPNNSLEEKLLPVLLEEKVLLEDYGPRHPHVQGASKRVELARRFVTETLKQELQDLKMSEETIKLVLDVYKVEGKKAVVYEIEDDGYRRDIARSQALYDTVIKRLQEIDIVKDFGGYDAQPITPPTQGKKVAPKATIIFAAALMLGLLGGLGLAFVAEMTDRTFRNVQEVRSRLGLPVLGQIPVLAPRPEDVDKAGELGLAPTLVTVFRPKSREAESYRGVRTSIYFSTHGERHKVIQITSPGPGDGKTTLISNLAVSIAQSGKSVLLIDADLRRPRVQQMFGITNRIGLSGLLTNEVELEDAIVASKIPGLSILPCGQRPANPAELLTSPRLPELLAVVREKFDFVLVDTPPVLAVTDPCVVAPRVDGILLTFGMTKNGRPLAERAKDTLNELNAKLFGVVLNGVEGQGKGYGYGYGYEENRYYEEDSESEPAPGPTPELRPRVQDGNP